VDADALLSYRSLPDVARWVPFDPMTAEVIAERLAGQWSIQQIDDEDQSLTLGVERRDTGELIGDVILFWLSRLHGNGEIGYTVSPAAAGNRYAAEAAHAMLHVGFDDLGLRRIIARLDADNIASARVAMRLGMRQEAHLVQNEWFKGRWSDELDFALLKSEWDTQHPTAGCPSYSD
jgi:RimJ/RimL family protein N-acetyltransferase